MEEGIVWCKKAGKKQLKINNAIYFEAFKQIYLIVVYNNKVPESNPGIFFSQVTILNKFIDFND